jgi:hypothetical protein
MTGPLRGCAACRPDQGSVLVVGVGEGTSLVEELEETGPDLETRLVGVAFRGRLSEAEGEDGNGGGRQGNSDGGSNTVTFEVDIEPPEVTLVGPASPSNNTVPGSRGRRVGQSFAFRRFAAFAVPTP